jgi:hypothetical protein
MANVNRWATALLIGCGIARSATASPAEDSCTLDASWTQGPHANNWWAEYGVTSSAPLARVSLEVVGVESVPLSLNDGRWSGLPQAVIATAATVVVHAEDTAGDEVSTEPFAYLEVTTPETRSCSGPKL